MIARRSTSPRRYASRAGVCLLASAQPLFVFLSGSFASNLGQAEAHKSPHFAIFGFPEFLWSMPRDSRPFPSASPCVRTMTADTSAFSPAIKPEGLFLFILSLCKDGIHIPDTFLRRVDFPCFVKTHGRLHHRPSLFTHGTFLLLTTGFIAIK